MAYGYHYTQPAVPGYFNTNYMPPQQMETKIMSITQVPDELTALNAQFPMDGSPVFFVNSNGVEIYSKQLSMANGSVIFKRYRLTEDAKPDQQAFVTHDEMDVKIKEIYSLLDSLTAPSTNAGGEKK